MVSLVSRPALLVVLDAYPGGVSNGGGPPLVADDLGVKFFPARRFNFFGSLPSWFFVCLWSPFRCYRS
ncbi:unnamed protein product [Amaranthus hypochondriacus]